MSYPPPSGPPDPYQPQQPQEPQQPYGPSEEPTTPYSQQYGQYPQSGYPSSGEPYQQSPGQPYAQSPYGQPGYQAYGAQPRTNSLAIASLICSIAGLATCISAPVGIVLGHIAKRQIRDTGEGGSGLATAGLWIGYILTIGGIIAVVAIVIVTVYAANTTATT